MRKIIYGTLVLLIILGTMLPLPQGTASAAGSITIMGDK